MSVQSEFFDALQRELIARGLDAAVAEENVSRFKEQLVSRAESEEQLNSALSKIPPASIAENIYNMIRSDEGDTDAGAKSEVMVIDTESDTVSTKIREGRDAVAPLADDAENDLPENNETAAIEETDDNEASDEIGTAEEAEAEIAEEEAAETDDLEAIDGISDTELDDVFGEHSEETDNNEAGSEETAEPENNIEADDSAETEGSDETDGKESFTLPGEDEPSELRKYSPGAKRRVHSVDVHSAAQTPPGERKTVRRATEAVDLFPEDGEGKTSWLFIVMAIVLIPIAFLIGAAIFVFFIGLWLALAVIITVLLVGLVGLVAAGTAISLAGLIFGVIESISGRTASGMFEIGLALIVGAVVMFTGIWLYNFAVRFIPFIIQKLGVLLIKIFGLFKKSFRKIKVLTSRI